MLKGLEFSVRAIDREEAYLGSKLSDVKTK